MATIAGNVVNANGNPEAARSATPEFDAAFGGGIVVIGGVGDVITKNRVIGSTKIGVAIAPNPGIQQNAYPSTGNSVTDNVVQESGLVDLAVVLPTADDRNCFSGNTVGATAPTNLEQLKPCGGAAGSGDLSVGAIDIGKFLDTSANPAGKSYQVTPVPPRQRNLAKATTARARPAGAPVQVDLARITVPVSAG
jgi:hypothetical protein